MCFFFNIRLLVKLASYQNIWLGKGKNVELEEREKKQQKVQFVKDLANDDDMDAESADKILKPLENYVGIFDPEKLEKIKIVSYPSSILVLTQGHWISLYMTENEIEVMDSMGYFSLDDFDENIRKFLTAHATGKQLTTTPQLQPSNSDLCAFYAICFLYYRSVGCGNLCDFCKLFQRKLSYNSALIRKMFTAIRKIN